tara:strand:+ start:13377 stop:15857 length:2481 start_codon:yes stop_codon:yes gene_type:complete
MALKEKQLKIQSTRAFPDPLAPNEEKATEEYGLKMAKLIEYEWFYIQEGNTTSSFYDQRLKFDKLRRYARGEQDTDLYKKLLTDGTDGDSYTNYDWRPIQVLPKFVKLVVNQMMDRLYEIDAQAIDGVSQGLRDDFRDILEKNMVAKPMLEDAKNLLNIDLIPSEDIPDSAEELNLHMKLRYKPNIEVAIEEALKYTLQLNDYPELQRQLLLDLVTIGVSSLHHKTDPTKGIVVEYKDPADMVWSYPTFSNFRKVYYYGDVERITLNELQRISGKKFTKEELEAFKNVSNEWQGYNRISNQFWYRGEDLPNYLVDVLSFTYKTTKTTKYKKKYRKNGSYSITKRDSDFTKPQSVYDAEEAQGFKDYDILEDVIDVWYEGTLVLGSQMIFNYRECENMIRPEGYINNNVMSNYVMYAPELYQGRIQALTERVIPSVDQLQQIKIKIQQFIAKAKPNGIWVDVDGLQELDLGEGQSFSPLELIRYYDETGNLIGTSKLMDGGYSNGSLPIKELNNGGIAGLEQLMNAYNFHLQMFREFIGIGQGADASLPDPRTSVAATQQTQENSNVATRYILEGQLKITQYLLTGLSLRLKDIFQYSNLKNAYINSIGKINMDVIESLKTLHLHDFGIAIKLKPDAQERMMLEQNILAEITAGGISTTDGIDIRKVGNLTLANEMLKIRKQKHQKQQHEREVEKITAQSEGNTQTAKATSKAKMDAIALEHKGKKELVLEERESIRVRIKAELDANRELMQLEYQLQTGKDIAISQRKDESENKKEDRKDKRTAIQATQQSKMKAEQSKEGGGDPIDFTSDYASIEGDLNVGTFRV